MLRVRRAGKPLTGYWSIPGGLLETGESLEDAVCREVREETGLRVEVDGFFEIFQRIMHDDAGRVEYHYVLVDYLCRVVGGKLRAGDDVSEVAWVAKNRLQDYTITEGTRAVIERAFSASQKRT